MNVYDFNVFNNKGERVYLNDYKGKVLLIVNTATKCGFTPQYNDLEALYKEYKDRGFEILDFPCNQFGHQAPGSDEEIQQFCTLRFGTEFPRFKKIEVNGPNEHPLYTWLKDQSYDQPKDESHRFMSMVVNLMSKINKTEGKDIKWNFTKFLIDKNGEVACRFEPTITKDILGPAIESLLK